MEGAELKSEVPIPCKLVQKAFIFKEREDERKEEARIRHFVKVALVNSPSLADR